MTPQGCVNDLSHWLVFLHLILALLMLLTYRPPREFLTLYSHGPEELIRSEKDLILFPNKVL